jgi:hypothetical protein
MTKLVLLEARLKFHQAKALFKRVQLERWQKTGQTAHRWQKVHEQNKDTQDAARNAQQVLKARAEILRWKNSLHEDLKQIDKYNAAIRALRPQPPTSNVTMYDSIEVATVPSGATAVAGYVGGKWPTYDALVKAFPTAQHVSIAIAASEDADCLDIENGDATPDEAPAWVRRQQARGVKRPKLYASVSVWPEIEFFLKRAGIKRSEYVKWGAHYTGVPRLESDFDAIQYTDAALGRNLDASLCAPSFFR